MLYVFFEMPKKYTLTFEDWKEVKVCKPKIKEENYNKPIPLTEEQIYKLLHTKARKKKECIYCITKGNLYSRGLCKKCYNLLKKYDMLPNKKHLNRANKNRFKKIRLKILERDDYKCVECGSSHWLNVHHIKERNQGGDDSDENLVTLCYECHMEKHKTEPIYNLMKSRLVKSG
ncbi:HNH endonuclease [Clostridium botulinum]|uniref:HNH endonuclease n=1 Tax=Clostridium botulinum TaxID=1491 RepID=UPI0019683581